MRARAGAFLWLVALPALAATTTKPPLIDDYREIHDHFLGPEPVVLTPWSDITEDKDKAGWSFELTIDETGKVLSAYLRSGSRELRDEATRAALAVNFKPFLREGRAVAVRLKQHVYSREHDYAGPADREFPADPDLSTVVIALQRTGCYGTCADYRVELRGDGEVRYLGKEFVLVRGEHRWHVDPSAITPLLDLLRRANYFALKGFYVYGVTDFPTYVTRVSVGDRHKFVLDYAAYLQDARGSPDDPQMPPVVTEIEEAIDRISGVASYVNGDEATMARLRAEHWNFQSKDAGHGLRNLLSDCKTAMAREFVDAGAPVNVVGENLDEAPPAAHAARCGDVELARRLVAKGAVKRRSDARAFLWSSVASGNPGMVALALKHSRDVNMTDENGSPLLSTAASSYPEGEGDESEEAGNAPPPATANFDSAKVIELLIAAGAKPNARFDDGKTPIFDATTEATVAALLKGGADPNARDDYGNTALFDHYFAEPKRALVAAGADVNVRNEMGRTALFFQDGADSIKVLLDGGADIDVADAKGYTAIERMNSLSGTSALLAAGAKLPTDPARLEAMIAKAHKEKWTELLPQLEAAKKAAE